jgi:hypothetical protein
MWDYEQISGKLLADNGDIVAIGYSGHGDGKNNPDMEHVADVGPIPVGIYTIETPRDTDSHGPYVLPLTPSPANTMFGRSGFLIHGDAVHAPGTASEGCVILAHTVREQIWESGDHRLNVVSRLPDTVVA